jgi:hypothetical protein
MSVSLLRLQSDEILLGYMVKNAWDDCRLYVRPSADEMRSLGEAVCAIPESGYHVVNNDRLVQLSSGRILAPAALHRCTDGTRATWDPNAVAGCFLSDDGGRTWRKARTELEGPAESRSGLQEPGVIELADGRILMWMRTDLGCQYRSVSEDGGDTWTRAEPSPLASPLSPASVKRMPWDGSLLVVWNDHSGRHRFPRGRRTPLCAALSRDEGRTWLNSRILEGHPDGWFCYTSIAFIEEAVLLAYCAGDSQVGGLNRLRISRVPREWIAA